MPAVDGPNDLALPKAGGGPPLDKSGRVIGVAVSKPDVPEVYGVTGELPQNIDFAVKGAPLRGFLDIHGVNYRNEAMRLLGVMDTRLGDVEYLAGDHSIADIATWPWVMRAEWYDTNWDDFPDTKRRYDTIAARPAVERGLDVD